MNWKTIPIFLAFLCMGFADAVGPFVGLAKESFNLSNAMAQMLPFMGFIMFGLLSIPAGILQDKVGKKKILILGLFVALLGLIFPTFFGMNSYPVFLSTVMFIGAGASILQVAGNPIMRDVSVEGKYSRNLSIAQFVKAIGSLSGPAIPAAAAYIWKGDWRIVFPIYAASLLLTLLTVAFLKVKEEESTSQAATFASCFSLLKNRFVLMMVFGIFVYVGAEVCMSSQIPLYLKEKFGIDIQTMGMLGTGLFFIALTIGRFLGGVILNWMAPKKFFILTCVVSIIGIALLFFSLETLAIPAVLLTGFGFANIFPLVFSITVDSMPTRSNELSGLMVTAICGGALVPLLMGVVTDLTTSLFGFLVPMAAILYISWTALIVRQK
ncbi:MFS transporter [candidate division KSB1 bacterium]|nr:MFS transporter [candidate division KSB1 bacterium]RQW08427.1 MAG: MFS transporter [candidate division KSB1 bacterium]